MPIVPQQQDALKQARELLERAKPFTSSLAIGAPELHSAIKDFLARTEAWPEHDDRMTAPTQHKDNS